MPVTIEQFTSDVTLEGPSAAPADDARRAAEWKERAKLADLAARAARDALRTRARGHDD